jgi:serine protease AprX
MAQITINGITFDPASTRAAVAAAAPLAPDASASNYILIQTRAPLTAA